MLDIKKNILNINNFFDRLINKLNTAEEKIKTKKTLYYGTTKKVHHIHVGLQKKNQEKNKSEIFEARMTENFPKSD